MIVFFVVLAIVGAIVAVCAAVLCCMQRLGLMISPEHHARHHHGKFDRNFCIFTGWADYVLNPLVRLLPEVDPL